jgi:transposase
MARGWMSTRIAVSGLAILAALIEGRADPSMMAELAKGRLRRKIPPLEQALTGLVRDHHRRLLIIQLTPVDFLDEQIDALSAEITRTLMDWSGSEPSPPQVATPRQRSLLHPRRGPRHR